MSDHRARACTFCGSLLHHEHDCKARRRYRAEGVVEALLEQAGVPFKLPTALPGMARRRAA
jgi:hypothetical protein